MGCNIHGVVEVKEKDAWRWLCEIPWNRDCLFYAQIAGVRNHWGLEPISSPRGMPDDVDDTTRHDYEYFMEHTGGHDLSYLTANEVWGQVKNMITDNDSKVWELIPIWKAWRYFIGHLGNCYGMDNVRMVFWFDN